ncbi:hypothetical protein EYF80_012860 [Liparis tanakae]|uniref:Uncharacterized protein n=1 Tax=Liparis tanakae TaxID=230148 RepID=A0A4Z2IG94_9TELE|nr:hypothetical protein EYF80_012860 [Liparis tanakae]
MIPAAVRCGQNAGRGPDSGSSHSIISHSPHYVLLPTSSITSMETSGAWLCWQAAGSDGSGICNDTVCLLLKEQDTQSLLRRPGRTCLRGTQSYYCRLSLKICEMKSAALGVVVAPCCGGDAQVPHTGSTSSSRAENLLRMSVVLQPTVTTHKLQLVGGTCCSMMTLVPSYGDGCVNDEHCISIGHLQRF